MQNQTYILTLAKKLMMKILKLKLVVVRVSKYKNILGKGYVPNCSEEVQIIF